jgi:hypothetical protein
MFCRRKKRQYASFSFSVTLRLVYLTEQQYAGMMDNAHVAANNNTTAEAQLPYIYQQEQTTRLVPIAGDATRNASSYKPPAASSRRRRDEDGRTK